MMALSLVFAASSLAQAAGEPAEFTHEIPKPDTEWLKEGEQRGAGWLREQRDFLAKIDATPGWHQNASGLRFRRESSATDGERPAPGSWVKARYVGRLADGTLFHRSPGDAPVEVPLSGVVAGWREGVAMMRTGETWRFVIPSALGYGDKGRGPVPGGAVMIFDIILVAAETPERG
ncbi:FKBP-type peptidyl-prolyl cis-trans isomerase [Sphingopyxis sp. 22461]